MVEQISNISLVILMCIFLRHAQTSVESVTRWLLSSVTTRFQSTRHMILITFNLILSGSTCGIVCSTNV